MIFSNCIRRKNGKQQFSRCDRPVAGGRRNWKNIVDDAAHEVPPEFAQSFGCGDGFLVCDSQQTAQMESVFFYVRYFGFDEIRVFTHSSLALFQNFIFWANFMKNNSNWPSKGMYSSDSKGLIREYGVASEFMHIAPHKLTIIIK